MRKPLVSATLAVLSLFMLCVNQSQACCFLDCFKCFKPAAPPPTYAAACCPAPAPTCDVCPQQVNYVPQTCCSTAFQSVPVTMCKPVTSCCGQTTMQPVTTFVQRPISVPVTTMRPIATQLNYAPACSACSGAAYSSPYYTGMPVAAAAPMMAPAPMASPSCPTCGGGSQVSYAAPAMAAPAMTVPQTYPTPGTISAPAMSTPNLSSPPMSPTPAVPGSTPSTFAPSTSSSNYSPAPATPMTSAPMTYPATPIPTTDPAASSTMNAPRLLDPQNRTTSTGGMIGPATVTNAIFNTADRGKVFHPASQTSAPPATDSWSTSPNDGWGSK